MLEQPLNENAPPELPETPLRPPLTGGAKENEAPQPSRFNFQSLHSASILDKYRDDYGSHRKELLTDATNMAASEIEF